jgi:exonuclease SbcC
LTNAGLFIFWSSWFWKIFCFEAIGFVLWWYRRLNKTDKRSYNMLNLKSDKANIEFEFLNFEERKFKFVTDWKRKKFWRNHINRTVGVWMEREEWVPMTSADATEIMD